MFDKFKFAEIIKNIKGTYSSQEEFAKKSDIGRTYLSQYMNMKLKEPPKPKILQKLAENSNGITTYNELMNICGYLDDNYFFNLQSLKDTLKENEEFYLNKLVSYSLTNDEKEIYDCIIDIIDVSKFYGLSNNKIDSELNTYFNNTDYISAKSKQKIKERIKLFIECCFTTRKIENSLFELEYEHNYSNNKNYASANNIHKNLYDDKVFNHLENYNKLNDLGKQTADIYVEALTEISKYIE